MTPSVVHKSQKSRKREAMAQKIAAENEALEKVATSDEPANLSLLKQVVPARTHAEAAQTRTMEAYHAALASFHMARWNVHQVKLGKGGMEAHLTKLCHAINVVGWFVYPGNKTNSPEPEGARRQLQVAKSEEVELLKAEKEVKKAYHALIKAA